ncbi:MAG: hypothetical protein ACFCU8_11140 [Thermosynechococcaceae cyanobacterium]
MAKTPSFPQQLLTWTENWAFSTTKHSVMADVLVDATQSGRRWLGRLNRVHNGSSIGTVVCVGAIALFTWNWQLFLALIMGAGTTALAYRGLPVQKWMRLLIASPVVSAALLGLFSVIVSYSTLLIWQDTGRFGIALAVFLQGVCTLLALGLLAWQLLKPAKVILEEPYDRWVTQLTAPEPLQRLIAVRRLTQIDVLTSQRRQELSDYFQLLLAQETYPQVRDAVVDGLKHLEAPASRVKHRVSTQRSLTKRRIMARKERVYAELEVQPEESWVQ